MDKLTVELYRTRKIPLVARAYCTSDLKSVAVELMINPSIIGLEKKNTLLFLKDNFLADHVNSEIIRIIAESAAK